MSQISVFSFHLEEPGTHHIKVSTVREIVGIKTEINETGNNNGENQ